MVSLIIAHQVVTILLRSGQFSQSYLSRSDMPHTALLIAAKQGHNEIIGLLVRHGFDVNRKLPGSNGTCLHEAALYGKVDTVRYLLQVSHSMLIQLLKVLVLMSVYPSIAPCSVVQISLPPTDRGTQLWTLSTCTLTHAQLVS